MTTDNRTNEPNKYAGFLARQGHQRDPWRGVGVKCLCGKLFDLEADHAMHQVDEILRAALVAAAGAAALDGVPEPEWEYGYRGRYAVMHPTKAGQRIETPEITQRTPDNWLPEMGEIYRRRPSTPAGPWEQIKGESDD